MSDWIKISDREPTIHDYDRHFSIWISGVYGNTGNRIVRLVTAREYGALMALKGEAIDYWMPTNLVTPEPPEDKERDRGNHG